MSNFSSWWLLALQANKSYAKIQEFKDWGNLQNGAEASWGQIMFSNSLLFGGFFAARNKHLTHCFNFVFITILKSCFHNKIDIISNVKSAVNSIHTSHSEKQHSPPTLKLFHLSPMQVIYLFNEIQFIFIVINKMCRHV